MWNSSPYVRTWERTRPSHTITYHTKPNLNHPLSVLKLKSSDTGSPLSAHCVTNTPSQLPNTTFERHYQGSRRTYLKAVTQAFLWGSSVSQSATFLPSAECPAVANNEELPPWEIRNERRGYTLCTLDSKTWKTKSAVFLPCVCIVKKGTAVEAACRWSR